MAKCDVCGKNGGSRVISGILFCEACFSKLQKIRNYDMLTIQYYLDPENYAESTEKAKNHMMEQAQSMTEYCKCNQQKDQQSQIDTEIYKNIIMTTTNSIEGYNIVKYIDLVCGEVVVPNGLLGIITSGTFFTINSLEKARVEAIKAVKKNAYNIGANAIVAVDIDINDMNGNGVIVSVNGTAVFIEKEEQVES